MVIALGILVSKTGLKAKNDNITLDLLAVKLRRIIRYLRIEINVALKNWRMDIPFVRAPEMTFGLTKCHTLNVINS